jgi:energy-coupling factor transporter ATP-binding protein EcfA2
MIEKVSIRHFQSLQDVTLELAPLTVIVGRSSSGKSALTRALKTLTSNQRGSSFISHGEQQCVITAWTDRGVVALSRGKKDEYVIVPNDGDRKSFTKLAGSTPEEVTLFLGIPSKDPLNYSSQFDMPYLLTASAGEVARTLGELTNVHVIFEAAREANRLRLATTQELKVRLSDKKRTDEQLEGFVDFEQERETLTRLRQIIKRALELEARRDELLALIAQAEKANKILAQTRLERKPVPNLTKLRRAVDRAAELDRLIKILRDAEHKKSTAEQAAAALADELELLQEEHDTLLHEAGTCPTCGQTIE